MRQAIVFPHSAQRAANGPRRPDIRWIACALLTACGLAAYASALFLFARGLWTCASGAG